MKQTCHIIGFLDNGAAGLSAGALSLVRGADLVIGGARALALFRDELAADAVTRDLGGALSSVPGWVRDGLQAGHQVVVLATGDPLCFGIGGYLIDKLGRDHCQIHSNVSTAQLAAARLGLPWHQLTVRSVHSRDAGEWHGLAGSDHGLAALLQDCRTTPRLAVFTSPDNSPDRIARMLHHEGLAGHCRLHVAERLLMPEETIHEHLSVTDAAAMHFAEPNVLLIENLRPAPVLFGLADHEYEQRKPDKGLITKQEVRAVSLAAMRLRHDAVVWDIGAGSGSIGLEAARLCHHGQVYAIEKNDADLDIIRGNRRRAALGNYTLVHGKAPASLDTWPDPDAVFIGGSGGELPRLIDISLNRLKTGGVLVMNLVTLENLHTAMSELNARQDIKVQLSQLQISRSRPILDMLRLAAENPVWIIAAVKGENSE